MNNSDERDYAEEADNARTLREIDQDYVTYGAYEAYCLRDTLAGRRVAVNLPRGQNPENYSHWFAELATVEECQRFTDGRSRAFPFELVYANGKREGVISYDTVTMRL